MDHKILPEISYTDVHFRHFRQLFLIASEARHVAVLYSEVMLFSESARQYGSLLLRLRGVYRVWRAALRIYRDAIFHLLPEQFHYLTDDRIGEIAASTHETNVNFDSILERCYHRPESVKQKVYEQPVF